MLCKASAQIKLITIFVCFRFIIQWQAINTLKFATKSWTIVSVTSGANFISTTFWSVAMKPCVNSMAKTMLASRPVLSAPTSITCAPAHLKLALMSSPSMMGMDSTTATPSRIFPFSVKALAKMILPSSKRPF